MQRITARSGIYLGLCKGGRANKLAHVWLEYRTHEDIHGAFQPESRVNTRSGRPNGRPSLKVLMKAVTTI